MHDEQTTEAVVYTDGYGGVVVLDETSTHADIVQFLKDESVYEVFDDVIKKEKGKYKAVFNFWWEGGCHEYGENSELVIDYNNMKFEKLDA